MADHERRRRADPRQAQHLGYLIEVGQSTGLLDGRLAKKRPGDLPG
jgi:hypothetical protein